MTHAQLIAETRKSLLIYAARKGITQACKTFNVSRTTYYKLKKQYLQTGSLEPKVRRKPSMPNKTKLSKMKILLKIIQQKPGIGVRQYVRELRKQGIIIIPSTLNYCLTRLGLNRKYFRLLYVEQLNRHKQPLTEQTLRQMQYRIKHDIKRGHWPGHIVALDTFYVGNLKGVGRIYQLTGIDLCSRFGWARLYTAKTQESSCDFFENTLVPGCFHNNIRIESVLTDNGSEFIAKSFHELLGAYDVAHHRIPAGKPMCNGYCERFQRTILDECYKPIFRKQFFSSLADLQQALDEYLLYYNFDRAHFGLSRNGVVPAEAFTQRSSFLRSRFHELLT